jgi:uncharacterized repeat protein (TIGR01451 family)
MRTTIVAGAMLVLAGVARAATGGPDAFGYEFVDSREAGGPAAALIDISATGTPVLVGTVEDGGDDIASAPIDLTAGGTRPGFRLYGVLYPAVVMTSNGYLTTDLDDPGNDFTNDCPLPQNPSVPVGTHGARVYVLHDDLLLTPGIGAGYHQYFPSAVAAGRAPDRGPDVGVHVFLWKSAAHRTEPPAPEPPLFDFEALLYDNGDLVFVYGPGDVDSGLFSTTGIQDPAPPTMALQVACNTAGSLAANLAVLVLNPLFADIALTTTVDVRDPPVGDPVTYTVIADNAGRVPVPDVRVNAPLAGGLALLAAAVSAGTYDAASGTWHIPLLKPDGAAALTLVARVGADQAGRVIVSSATRIALAAPLFDGVPANDTAAVIVVPQPRPPRVGFGLDRDGDGFSDDFETVAGSSPSNVGDTPFGVAATAAPLAVDALRIRLEFTRPGRDAIRVAGRLPVADGFDLAGRTVVLDVGGVATRFVLEARGAGGASASSGGLRIGPPRRNVARFVARLRAGQFGDALGTNAGLGNATARRERRTVRVSLLLSPVVLTAEQPVLYTAARGRRGRARETHR